MKKKKKKLEKREKRKKRKDKGMDDEDEGWKTVREGRREEGEREEDKY